MTHDPMCDWWTEQCKIDCSEYGSYDPCPHDSCLCDLIARVRADERWRIIGVMERNADGDAIKVIDAVLDML